MSELGHLRADFPILRREINGAPLVYLDSAATTQKPQPVLDAMDEYYANHNANVHRGAHTLAAEATERYEDARSRIASFVDTASAQIAFTRGATAAINVIAYGWGLNHLREGDRIVVSVSEHHANLVPWQMISRYTGAELIYLELDDEFIIDTSNLEAVIDDRVRIVAFGGMSNVTGALGPVDALVDAAHSVGAITVLDGAQLVPHAPVSADDLGVDYMVFSAHKMLGPTGIGALWGKPERLEELEPLEGGGEMINIVERYHSTWAPVPHKFEAGTPPIAEAIGFGAAVDYLGRVGMEAVAAHEREITAYALERLSEVPDLTIYGPKDVTKRGGAVSFSLGDIHPHDLATIVDQDGVAIRAGHHCARPLMQYLQVPATARASFYLYNLREEVDVLVGALMKARKVFGLG
ncbi:MAG: SufS family cysteine desulfurase [Acidimicrobiia bacterium]|nr:SufS family cysteine desulfurase [Acidimicrobiia bacterium]